MKIMTIMPLTMTAVPHQMNSNRLAFAASALSKHKFESLAVPFCGHANLDWYLKLWGKRLVSNDICQWAGQVARAKVENNAEQLGEQDLQRLFANEDNSPDGLENTALLRWFERADAVWLDHLRRKIDQTFPHNIHRALAISAAFLTGDYLLSFTPETAFLRRPLKDVYRAMLKIVNQVIDNYSINRVTTLESLDFISRIKVEALYAALPLPAAMQRFLQSPGRWRETWLRQTDQLEEILLPTVKDSLSGQILSQERYLQVLDNFLDRSKAIRLWAIAWTEVPFLSLESLAEAVKRHRPVNFVYLHDGSAVVSGGRQGIIMAEKG
jgi:hypothetical protein